MEKYAELKKQYPDFIYLDEVSRICKIAKRSARYLVENGIIPAIDTGKQTWRYQITIDDVIDYLKRREKFGSMIPPGAVTSRYKEREAKTSNRKSFAEFIKKGQEHKVGAYFKFIYAEYGEVLTTLEVAEMTGFHKNTVQKLAKAGHIKWLERRPTYLIPKQYLLDFVVTRRFLEAKTDSEAFKKLLGGFEIWKIAKS